MPGTEWVFNEYLLKNKWKNTISIIVACNQISMMQCRRKNSSRAQWSFWVETEFGTQGSWSSQNLWGILLKRRKLYTGKTIDFCRERSWMLEHKFICVCKRWSSIKLEKENPQINRLNNSPSSHRVFSHQLGETLYYMGSWIEPSDSSYLSGWAKLYIE